MTGSLSASRPASAAAPGRRTGLAAPLGVALAVGSATVALAVRDPHVPGSYGFCPWLLLTGGFCPGCGGLRAVHDLAHGDLAAAASANLLLVSLVPLAALLWLGWLRARWRGRVFSPPLLSPYAVWSLAPAVLVFTVARNLDAGLGAWLAP